MNELLVKGVASSFVFNNMKIESDKGSGEAKLFVGSKAKKYEYDAFFEFEGDYRYSFDVVNLREYMLQVKMEYVFQRMNKYKEAGASHWEKMFNIVESLKEDDCNIPLSNYVDDSRYYVRSEAGLFKNTVRKIIVPKITDIQFIKDDVNRMITIKLCVNYGFNGQKADGDPESINNEKEFRIWLGKIMIPERDVNGGQPYSAQTIDTYVADIKFHKTLVDGQEITLFETNDIAIVNSILSKQQVSSQRKTAINKYKQFLTEKNARFAFHTGYSSEFSRNRIVFGAPGTGKSFLLNSDAQILVGDDKYNYERVTFHPDYSYANFVGTYKPVPSKDDEGNDTITYEYVPGPFMRVYVKALKNSKANEIKPYLLLIEEINRANVAAVFGDVFQLLDRDDNNISEYPIQASEDVKKYLAKELGGEPADYTKIRIPDNMFIWATMNSADQGVFPMDTAFKRRWDFTYLGIDERDTDIRGKYVTVGTKERQRFEWNELRKAINNFLADEKINEDKQLGPYFISRNIVVPADGETEIDSDRFCDVFKHKVLMYLFDDAAKQKRGKLFEGSAKGQNRYSQICQAFDEQGIGIFNSAIQTGVKIQDIVTNGYELDENGMVNKDE